MNILIGGMTRSGKSTAELVRLVQAAMAGKGILVCDPHGSLAWALFKQLVYRKIDCLYERLADTKRVLKRQFLVPSTAEDEWERRGENDERTRAFADLLCRRRAIKDLAERPLIAEWTTAALNLWISQKVRPPLWFLPYAFRPGSEPYDKLLAGCTDEGLKWKFERLYQMSAAALRGEAAPAERFVSAVCESPAFMIRCGGDFDIGEYVFNGGIYIMDGSHSGNLSEDAFRVMAGSAVMQVIQAAKRKGEKWL